MRLISSSGVTCSASALVPRLSLLGSLQCLAQRYTSSLPALILVTDRSRRRDLFVTTPSRRFLRRVFCWPALSQALGSRRCGSEITFVSSRIIRNSPHEPQT